MKRFIVAFVVLTFIVGVSPGFAQSPVPPQFPKTKILVLGTYHMNNPGRDVFNLEADDVLAEKRQAEIEAVVAALAEFQPNKIALESDFGTERIVKEYQAYLTGDYGLTRDEIDQIGYRLAKRLGHETVFPVDADVDGGMTIEEWERSMSKFSALNGALNHYGTAYTKTNDDKLKSSTVGQYLAFINSPALIAANHFSYSAFFMKMAEGEDNFGVTYVSDWYKRNLLIVANILQIANPDGSDRILVMFGQGHAYLLKQFLEESPYFEVVDALDYLPKE